MFLLHDALKKWAQSHPGSPAIIAPKRTLSYAQLDEQSDRLALHLIASGVSPGDPVAICYHKSIESIVAVYGIMKAGACYVPIDPFAPATRSAAIVGNTKPTHLVTSPERAGSLAKELSSHPLGISLTTIVVPESKGDEQAGRDRIIAWNAPITGEVPRVAITDTHLAYVLHTSGSTGAPKGVAITHRNALCFVEMAAAFWQVGPNDRLCSQAPLHFDLSVFDLYVAAIAGAAVVLIPEFWSAFPKKMASAIDEHQITIWNSVVSTLTLLMEKGKPERASLVSLRSVIFSGEVMPIRYLRQLIEHMPNAQMYNVYGQTEANSSIYYHVDRENIPRSDDWRMPLGKTFPNFEAYALDSKGTKIREPGSVGELVVRAGSVAVGYWGNLELSSDKFVIDPLHPESGARVYKTGDLVELDADGNFLFAGRSDDMVKSRGYRIELGEIDRALLACADIASAAAIAIADEKVGNRIYAFATLVEGSETSPQAILSFCTERLPKYMLPEQLILQDALPRTSTNKIDRRSLCKELMTRLQDSGTVTSGTEPVES